jgi:hypothetical protein
VRVRTLELRIIGVALVVCWTLTAGLVLIAYRPGGPIDQLVGLFAAGPIAIAIASVIWPPVTHGHRSFPAMVWLGITALLFLIPSMFGFVEQIQNLGSQTLLPSLEAGYPWFIALFTTSLFAGFGLARRILGQTAMRRRRLVRGIGIAALLTAIAGTTFAGAAVANDVALRDQVAATSRFGPTDPDRDPSTCDGPLEAGRAARLALRMTATVNLRPTGSIELTGLRAAQDYRWLAYVATDEELGSYGSARIGDRWWSRTPVRTWTGGTGPPPSDGTVDRHVLETALSPDFRATAEDRGIEIVGGARARRCRIAVDGETFRAAFPQARWLVGDADLARWRGQLDYWIFLDGQLGQVAGSANGEAVGIEDEALLAAIDVHLTATERSRDLVIYPPAP